MALQWFDGFDHYGATETNMTAGLWAEVQNSWTLVTTTPRTGTHCLQLSGTSSNLRRTLSSPQLTCGVGFGAYMTALPSNNNERLVAFRDTDNAIQVQFKVDTTGTISAYRGTAPTNLLGTSTVQVVANAWNHLEFKVVIASGTGGSVEARLNGVTILNVTGVNTLGGLGTGVGQIVWANTSGGNVHTLRIDDVFCWDSTGGEHNDFLGDHRVYTVLPDADGTPEQWTLSAGSDSYALIDEADPDGDTTYIQGDTNGDETEVGFAALPSDVVNIAAISLLPMIKKTDSGPSNFQLHVVSNGSEDSGADVPLTTAYTYWPTIFTEDPDTTLPWTRTGVDAATVRIERTA